jgi:hypothetical protein
MKFFLLLHASMIQGIIYDYKKLNLSSQIFIFPVITILKQQQYNVFS